MMAALIAALRRWLAAYRARPQVETWLDEGAG